MRQKLKKLLSLLKYYFKEPSLYNHLPEAIDNSEKLARSIFSPINIKNGKLLPNSFRTPPEIDEVSVNRLDYTTADFCKSVSKKIEQPEKDRNYFGLAIIRSEEIKSCSCTVVYTPILTPEELKNLYHADIKIGFIPKKGEQLPSEIAQKIKNLTNTARFYADPNPTSDNWLGQALT